VQFEGSIGYAPAVKNMLEENKILVDLVPESFHHSNDSYWGAFGFQHYYGLKNVVCYNPEVDLKEKELPLINETIYHRISGEGNEYLIELKE